MLFLLSKTLHFLITPLTWIVICLLFTLFSKNDIRRKKSGLATFVLLIFFSNTFIFDRFMQAWEIKAIPDDKLAIYDAGILLTGMATFDPKLNKIEFNDRTDRLLQAIRLFKNNKIKNLILCGGPVTLSGADTLEAKLLENFIESLGIPSDHIFVESKSRNTHENAVYTKPLLDTYFKGGNFLLISSAAHLTRAVLCFSKEGIKVVPYSTDRYSGPIKYDFDYLFLPSAATLFNWEKLLHEWIGIIEYKLMGYI
jgi:uncharacterized SAM-binding protein YcdF (DUF218 family)